MMQGQPIKKDGCHDKYYFSIAFYNIVMAYNWRPKIVKKFIE